jgi:predicted RNase H-like HicB family nuclease
MESPIKLRISLARETDGRWLASVDSLPGVMAYGATRAEAIRAASALALHVVADKLEHGELPRSPGAKPLDVRITTPSPHKRKAA